MVGGDHSITPRGSKSIMLLPARILFLICCLTNCLFLRYWRNNASISIVLNNNRIMTDNVDDVAVTTTSSSSSSKTKTTTTPATKQEEEDDAATATATATTTTTATAIEMVEDFDVSLEVIINIQCGRFKCFIPSRSNNTIGYIISQLGPVRFARVVDGYHFGQYLESKYGIPNYVLAPPKELRTNIISSQDEEEKEKATNI